MNNEQLTMNNVCGERYIGVGLPKGKITISGTPGNALAAYLDGGTVEVFGNAQDAVGDTMNDGNIIIHGNAGDALGYSMRGGRIFVKGDAGYRTGIHMKEYQDKKPVIIIGGNAGSFLGEYMAGGLIVILGGKVGNFTGTGMHGGKIFIKTDKEPSNLPSQVISEVAESEDLSEITPHITRFAEYFGLDSDSLVRERFYMLKPNAKNPYHQLYTAN